MPRAAGCGHPAAAARRTVGDVEAPRFPHNGEAAV